jgi:hypothetical protein
MLKQILIVKFIYINSSIQLFDCSIAESQHMMENHYIHCIHLFDRSISTHYIHQKKVFGEPYLGVAAVEVSMCACGSAAAVAEGGGGQCSSCARGDWLKRHQRRRRRPTEWRAAGT